MFGRCCLIRSCFLLSILLIGNVLHPLDDFTIQRFLNGDVSHCSCRRRAVPMLLVRRKPDHIARMDLLNGTALALRPTKTRRNDQRLTEWMCMPGGAGTRVECYASATNTCRRARLEQRVDAHRAAKPIGRSFTGWLRT